MLDVTKILADIDRGDRQATERLLPLVYQELRKLAAGKLRREKAGQTLQPTALVHEAYLRLVHDGDTRAWDSRGHFFAAAAEAMRRILIERARRRGAARHGGGLQRVNLDDVDIADKARAAELLRLDEALSALETHDRSAAELVKLRYFAGLGHQEAAAAMGITRRSADRLWALARAWLYQQISE